MKRSELKKILKPLIKECIKEVIFEEGTLSGIITEVAQGLSNAQVSSPRPSPAPNEVVFKSSGQSDSVLEARRSLEETKKSLQESTGLKGIFKGTVPMRSGGGQKSKHGALRDMDPNDPGVDISAIMSVAGTSWNQLK